MTNFVREMEMRNRLTPQMRMILNHVNRVGYITARAAIMDYGIMSLSRRICDFEDAGWTVETEERKNPATGQRYVRYFLKAPAEKAA
jgi:hypothetical protein